MTFEIRRDPIPRPCPENRRAAFPLHADKDYKLFRHDIEAEPDAAISFILYVNR